MFSHTFELSIGIKAGTLVLISLAKCDPWPPMLIVMDSALYASMHVLVDDECSLPHVCENASIIVNPLDCDDMLHESLGVVDIPNVKLLKKKAKKFHENLSKFFWENDDLIAKLNESNKLVEKYKKLAEILLKN